MQNEVSQTSSPIEVSLTGYTIYVEEKVLPAIISVCVEGEILWAYLDTSSSRNFISRETVFTTVRRPDMNQLKLKYSHTQDKRFYMTSGGEYQICLLYTSPSPRDGLLSRMPSSA